MGKFTVRYLVEKRQKKHSLFYWQPSKELIDTGEWFNRRLAEKTNNKATAIKEAEEMNLKLDAWYVNKDEPEQRKDTISYFIKAFQKDEMFTNIKSQKTKDGYVSDLRILENNLGKFKVKDITRKVAKALYKKLKEAGENKQQIAQEKAKKDGVECRVGSGLSRANHIMQTTRRFFFFCIDEGEITDNPFVKMNITKTASRSVIWPNKCVDYYVQGAIKEGCHSMALAVLMAAELGQRQGDNRTFTWNNYDGKGFRIQQGKTGRSLYIECTQELKEMLDRAGQNKTSTQIIVHEGTGLPYKSRYFKDVFQKIAEKIDLMGYARSLPQKEILDDMIPDRYWYMDLRRTAVVRLAMAGCSIPEIASISGHTIEGTTKILEVYLPRNSAMAKAAIAKLEAHKKK